MKRNNSAMETYFLKRVNVYDLFFMTVSNKNRSQKESGGGKGQNKAKIVLLLCMYHY